jgi:hypothetical protein
MSRTKKQKLRQKEDSFSGFYMGKENKNKEPEGNV